MGWGGVGKKIIVYKTINLNVCRINPPFPIRKDILERNGFGITINGFGNMSNSTRAALI